MNNLLYQKINNSLVNEETDENEGKIFMAEP
jgi:hypothetical protein